jgi:hypothetical protein
MEKDSIKTFESQLSLIEADLKTLWDRGDRLLFAAKLSDLRAKKNFDSYSKYVKLANEQVFFFYLCLIGCSLRFKCNEDRFLLIPTRFVILV